MVEELQLVLLGNLEICQDGVPVTGFISRKVQALLCYLAVTGRPIMRSTLASLLWGEMPESRARNNLSKALTNLRQLVRPYLIIDRQTVAYNQDNPYSLDVELFESLVRDTFAETDIGQLQRAVELYRGDFLEGFHVRQSPAFDDWLLVQRAQLREMVLQALHKLAVHHTRRGKAGYTTAIDFTTRLLALEPWREEAHRLMMSLLVQNGQLSAALAQYEVCRHVLAKELDVEPGVETVALYEQIRVGKLNVPTPIHTHGIIPHLPAFLDDGTRSREPTRPVFVARERELKQLNDFLNTAMNGEGLVAFIIGGPGRGKTALMQEFARQSMIAHPDLLVVNGNCSAYAGTGDPYLPFREVLGLLTGDVESRWSVGTISREHARRLWSALPLTLPALVHQGPILVSTLVSGTGLLSRAKQVTPGDTGWVQELRTLVKGSSAIGQEQQALFQQVTNVLGAVSGEYPLLVLLDDMQWVDIGSIGMLFHLGRRLTGNRILILCAYRPEEVSAGRGSERHPLEQLLNEFRAKFGDMWVDLRQADEEQGGRFVNTLLDTEPNRLDDEFRNALYARTGGHPLFTVEILRGMQERGDLVQDPAGRWVEGPTVDWASLPARVEAAIGARINRLPKSLQETLKVASVEGEVFTAEVVAQVLGAGVLETVGQLSGELDRRHRLVGGQDSQQTAQDGQRISRYRFRHILFQKYIYDSLDKVERTYLHEAVGNALEQLYAGHTELVAIQLARHFNTSARMDKAVDYFIQAGDLVRELYALTEARQHYNQALETLARLLDTPENHRRRVETLITQTSCSWKIDLPRQNLLRLSEAEQLVQEQLFLDEISEFDRLLLARIHFWMGRIHNLHSEYLESIRYFQQVLSVAQESGNVELTAMSCSSIGQIRTLQGYLDKAEVLLSQAIPPLEQAGNWAEWFRAMVYHGCVLAMMGNYAQGMAEVTQARSLAHEKNALTEIIESEIFLTGVYIHGGYPLRALEVAHQAVKGFEWSGDRFRNYGGNHFACWAAGRAGQYESAAIFAAKAQTIAHELGGRLSTADWLAANIAEIAYGAGHIQEALILAEQAVDIAQEVEGIFAEGLARRVWGQALAALAPPKWEKAEIQLTQSLRLLEKGHIRTEAARTHMAWGTVYRDMGDLTAARTHWEQAAAQWETSGLTHELERVRALMASLVS